MMPLAEAQARLLANVPPPPATERCPLNAALNMVLAETVTSTVTVPPSDNSAVDGYAVRYADLGRVLPVSQRIPAGAVPAPLVPGSAARIFTGAAVPAEADTVLMQEECEALDGQVRLPAASSVKTSPVKKGANIRRAGQDIRAGDEVVSAGTRLSPRHLGLLASVGVAEVSVYRPLRVALLSTGDELAEPGTAAAPGQIYNSNRYLLHALLAEAGMIPVDLGRVADDYAATHGALASAGQRCDLVLTTGGVSVGEEDHMRAAVAALGSLDLWRVAIKPGKPFAFGHLGDTPFMGLPGNPSAVLVTFMILVLPWLRRAQGLAGDPMPPCVGLPAGFSTDKPGKREEYLRVQVVGEAGQQRLQPHPNQSSGMLSSACWAEGLAVVPAGRVVREGDVLGFIRF
ncbi:molybdopterin biosynthesis protein [Isoalcanivorax pacificus W11-5]|uniref:Molybdopterin molybdenumtransferase n=1 Tax=Isoalcanivorax pacificus W11-5 TaxID=391936 RepID=A0A0B4XU21_9GAMM|nr:gephyrin-like molybdotransferase Glp [Isoalcanivorax pacificus]AJD49782.1 molybdopterin biosynthesis protein [Isoalcanivorax pacificus W11-5]